MPQFINRANEHQFLEDEFRQDRASLVILYGRRRIGKTTLVKHFIEAKTAFYFVATEEPERENKKNFQVNVADFTGNRFLKKDVVLEWEEILTLLRDYQPDVKKVVVIDEFQYLGKTNPSFPSILQKIWDHCLAEANIMMILCGSLVGMMIKQTLSYSSPLYGRRTGQIRLNQIPFTHYHLFYDNPSAMNLLEHYAVTGGVPKYIELLKPAEDIFKTIEHNILSKRSFLYEEPVFLLEQEFGETGTYFSIIKTIAAGNRKLGKIASVLGVSQSAITKYLKTLQDLDIITREVPVTEKNPEKSKKGLYRITDNFISFWFKFVYPYRSYLEIENSGPVIEKIKSNFRENHVSFIYEDICRNHLMDLTIEQKIPFKLLKIGRWWDKDTEIDLVGIAENEADIIFGECKYSRQKIDADIFYQLIEKSKKVPSSPQARRHYIIFSQSGFTDALLKIAESNENLYLESITYPQGG